MLVGALTLHGLVFFAVGFIPASIGLFVATTRLLGSRRWQRDAVIGVLGTLLLYVVFTAGLGVTLPADPLTRVLRR